MFEENPREPVLFQLIRQMISDSSDALDKMCLQSLIDSLEIDSTNELCIKIIPNKTARTLTIIDSGIGADLQTISQFSFYSAHLVADRVTIHSKNNGGVQYVLESFVGGLFTIKPDTGDSINNGTKIVLHIKEDQVKYLGGRELKNFVASQSQFICYPIKILVENTDKSFKEKTATVKFTGGTHDSFNLQPIWTRNSAEISQVEYAEYYTFCSSDSENYMAVKHFKIENQLNFHALLFVPLEFQADRKNSIKLYMRRIFMGKCDKLIPAYLNFMSGVVDFEDFSSDISRVSLRQKIRENLVDECLKLFEELAEDKEGFKKFYNQFGKNLKLGVKEDSMNCSRLIDLLRFQTSVTGDEFSSLSEYVDRMKIGQKEILYIIGESKDQVSSSMFVDRANKLGYEVMYMTHPIDDYIIQYLKEFQGKKLVDVTKEGFKWPEEKIEKHGIIGSRKRKLSSDGEEEEDFKIAPKRWKSSNSSLALSCCVNNEVIVLNDEGRLYRGLLTDSVSFASRMIGGGDVEMKMEVPQSFVIHVGHPSGVIYNFDVPYWSSVKELKIQVAEKFNIKLPFSLILDGQPVPLQQVVKPFHNTFYVLEYYQD